MLRFCVSAFAERGQARACLSRFVFASFFEKEGLGEKWGLFALSEQLSAVAIFACYVLEARAALSLLRLIRFGSLNQNQ
jgi:hypothetical protein